MALVPAPQQQTTQSTQQQKKSNEIVIPAPSAILADPRYHGVTNDALPYVDQEYNDPGMCEYVDNLVKQEMDNMASEENITLEDYEKRLPPRATLGSSEIIQTEMERIGRNEPMAKVDTTRYDPEKQTPPNQHQQDPEAWKQAIDNLKVQMEAKLNEHLNLELMNKYGADGYKRNADTVEQIQKRYQEQLAELNKKADIINKRRKRKQEEVSPRLQTLYRRWMETIDTNFHTELACIDMEKQLKKMRRSEDGE